MYRFQNSSSSIMGHSKVHLRLNLVFIDVRDVRERIIVCAKETETDCSLIFWLPHFWFIYPHFLWLSEVRKYNAWRVIAVSSHSKLSNSKLDLKKIFFVFSTTTIFKEFFVWAFCIQNWSKVTRLLRQTIILKPRGCGFVVPGPRYRPCSFEIQQIYSCR